MNIVTQTNEEIHNTFIQQKLEERMAELISPVVFNPTLKNYPQLMEYLTDYIQKYAQMFIKNLLESIDKEYRNAPGRTLKHYVKHTRERTIVSIYGEFTYLRTEYIDRSTKKPFCYVDQKIGLKKRERFDSCIKATVIELYANENSMIKVGKIVGDKIAGAYCRNEDRSKYWISRQTVYNILHKIKSLKIELPVKKETPEVLYIMADEKYIPLQGQKENEAKKQMVKVAVIFEGNEAVLRNDGIKTTRRQLTNKTVIIGKDNFWQSVRETIFELYDISKVKHIHLMGDGASWIQTGATELRHTETQVDFSLDRYHFAQAINRITLDKTEKEILNYYAIHDMQEDFNKIIDIILETAPDKAEKIETQKKYLNTHWADYQRMIKTVKIGCAMEQAISHIIASNFTSVPKAYGKKNILTYTNNRMNFMNNENFRDLIIDAMDKCNSNFEEVELKIEEYDFSFFDKPDTPSLAAFVNKHQDTILNV